MEEGIIMECPLASYDKKGCTVSYCDCDLDVEKCIADKKQLIMKAAYWRDEATRINNLKMEEFVNYQVLTSALNFHNIDYQDKVNKYHEAYHNRNKNSKRK